MRRLLFLMAAVLARNSKSWSKEIGCRDRLRLTVLERAARSMEALG